MGELGRPLLEPGQLIGDRFRLRRAVGEGGMGWVWEATDTTSSERLALKFLKGGKAEDRRRFLREARAALAVKHPNVITMREVVELPDSADSAASPSSLVTVMEFLEGESLGAVLKREKKIPLDVACAILSRVARALEAAHAAGIVHRDLKPDNVFLTAQGEVKVLDFGVAKLTASEGLAARTQALTGTGAMVGTPYYMSPEQVVSEDDLDGRADIWSLGVVLYECLAGVRPTEAENVGRVLKRIIVADFTPLAKQSSADDLPQDVLELVDRMLVTDRDRRPDLKRICEVLDAHASEKIPRFAPPAAVDGADDSLALADTVVANSARNEENEAARTNRGDTHAAVSVARPSSASAKSEASQKPRTRASVMFVGGVIVLASVVLAWRFGSGNSGTNSEAPTTTTNTVPETASVSATPSMSVPVIASAAPSSDRAAPPAPASTSVAAPPRVAAPVARPRATATPSSTATTTATTTAEPPPASATASSSAPPSLTRSLPPNLARSPKD